MPVLETYLFQAHKSIYCDESEVNYHARQIRTEMVYPDIVNEKTGMLVLIPGYGGNIDSHVFKKMREVLAEEYNMITLQCDYFGNKYMGSDMPDNWENVNQLTNIIKADIYCKADIHETEEEFNDMGIMQALDIISSTLWGIDAIVKKGLVFNAKRILMFGCSHGSYLAHLANILCPTLYSGMIDVSAYIYPYYLMNNRQLVLNIEKINWILVYEYMVMKENRYQYNKKLYYLPFLYRHMHNHCKIIALHGTEDWMVDPSEKQQFISELDNAQLLMIHPEDVDGVLCKNADHGLGLDFFELFKIVIPSMDAILGEPELNITIPKEVSVGDETAFIKISYENGLPELKEITW